MNSLSNIYCYDDVKFEKKNISIEFNENIFKIYLKFL